MSRGRPLQRYPVESAYRLDLAKLRRWGWLRPGNLTTGTMRWAYPWGDPEEALVTLNLGPAQILSVQFKGEAAQLIHLESSPQRFGGVRWWLVCPSSGRRCRVLYKPNGGRSFASRQAWGLVYRTQQMSPADRATHRMHTLAEPLGGDCDMPLKPKWMRWRTFERKAEKLAEAERAADGYFLERCARMPGMAEALKEIL